MLLLPAKDKVLQEREVAPDGQDLLNAQVTPGLGSLAFRLIVREQSQLCETFPTNLLASAFGFAGGDYFELESAAERVVPTDQTASPGGDARIAMDGRR